MKVRIAWTEDVSDDTRRAIRLHYGQPGLATREEVQQWFRSYGGSMNDDLSRLVDDAEAGDVDDDVEPDDGFDRRYRSADGTPDPEA